MTIKVRVTPSEYFNNINWCKYCGKSVKTLEVHLLNIHGVPKCV
jgi:hypothetical protein